MQTYWLSCILKNKWILSRIQPNQRIGRWFILKERETINAKSKIKSNSHPAPGSLHLVTFKRDKPVVKSHPSDSGFDWAIGVRRRFKTIKQQNQWAARSDWKVEKFKSTRAGWKWTDLYIELYRRVSPGNYYLLFLIQ